MKRIILISIIALIPALLSAQNSAVDKLFKKYGGQDGYTTISINGNLLKLAADLSDDEDAEVMKSITKIQILTQESGDGGNFYEEVMSELKRDSYEELMTVNSSDEDVIFLIRKNGDRISELLLVVGGSSDNAVIYIGGNLDMKDLAKLSKSINIDGDAFGHLEDLEKLDQ